MWTQVNHLTFSIHEMEVLIILDKGMCTKSLIHVCAFPVSGKVHGGQEVSKRIARTS